MLPSQINTADGLQYLAIHTQTTWKYFNEAGNVKSSASLIGRQFPTKWTNNHFLLSLRHLEIVAGTYEQSCTWQLWQKHERLWFLLHNHDSPLKTKLYVSSDPMLSGQRFPFPSSDVPKPLLTPKVITLMEKQTKTVSLCLLSLVSRGRRWIT